MTEAELRRDRLWAVFRLLELANVEAVRTRRQALLIANIDPQGGGAVELIPYRFHIDGHDYGALVTVQQRDRILVVIGSGTAEDVQKLIVQEFLEGHLYLAENLVTAILVSALTNQDMTAYSGVHAKDVEVRDGVITPVGACKFSDGSCQQPCGAPLCQTLGGTHCPACPAQPFLDADADADADVDSDAE